MTPREKELVEAVRELIAIPFGLAAYMQNPPPGLCRAEWKISNAMALYDGPGPITPDDPGIEETDIVMGR